MRSNIVGTTTRQGGVILREVQSGKQQGRRFLVRWSCGHRATVSHSNLHHTKACNRPKCRRPAKHFAWPPTLRELVDGLLLGDAYLRPPQQNGSSILEISQSLDTRHGYDHRPWVSALDETLQSCGLLTKVNEIDGGYDLRGGSYNPKRRLRTLSYGEFGDAYRRWYPRGKKIVPKDITLSPMSLANWFMGDGSNDVRNRRIKLHTEGFSSPGVKRLQRLLFTTFDLNFRVCRRKEGFYLALSRAEKIKVFLDLVGPYVHVCFDYKLKYRPLTGHFKLPYRKGTACKSHPGAEFCLRNSSGHCVLGVHEHRLERKAAGPHIAAR